MTLDSYKIFPSGKIPLSYLMRDYRRSCNCILLCPILVRRMKRREPASALHFSNLTAMKRDQAHYGAQTRQCHCIETQSISICLCTLQSAMSSKNSLF